MGGGGRFRQENVCFFLVYLGANLFLISFNILISAWWKLKVAQFKKIKFVTTLFGHHNVLSPRHTFKNIDK
jgi:hypothetical protein